jgi:hypothetical protein
MHWRSDPQRQTPLAVRGGPTVTRVWLGMAALLVMVWLLVAVLAP